MQLTKFAHACVRLADGDRALVIDPGVWSDPDAALDGVDAVLITHEHADHVDYDRVRAALGKDPRRRVWAPRPVVDELRVGDQAVAVAAGETFQAGGFAVRTFGGQHALIHPSIPVVANVGYLVEGSVYHPGDSLVVPDVAVDVLLLPTIAPWSKAAEVIDFAVSVRAPRVHQIHDAIATDAYAGLVEGHVGRIAGPHGVGFEHLTTGTTVST